MKQQIFLIRHAQSQSNVDIKVLQEKTNVGIQLTNIGLQQAKETGEFMVGLLKSRPNCLFKVWNSPYDRTRDTAKIIKQTLKDANIVFKEEESIYISERQFGIVDDAPDYQKTHPREFSHYELHNKEKKTYFARPPLGESPFDMCMRLDFFLRCVIGSEPEYNHIVVSHGAAVRGLIMMNEKLNYEEYLLMKNPYNACVMHLDGDNGCVGEIFKPSDKTSTG